ncbi:MAG: class I SAM-dependent methyltransferase [Clostridia bacterium]|nr:class I SAM-dependent methyltransferase [Clostridia bacterium]
MLDVIRHYDLLIDEGNDPVHDPAPLQEYMNRWDGEAFLQALALNGSQSVMEIGVGTGRLALRTAPVCRHFTGIDVSPKTVARAGANLAHLPNVTLLCGDFLTAEFHQSFDVLYSSLTFMHMEDKQTAVHRIAALLNPGGRAVISLDKTQQALIDYGTRKLRVYPDDPARIAALLCAENMNVLPEIETEFAHIVAAERGA